MYERERSTNCSQRWQYSVLSSSTDAAVTFMHASRLGVSASKSCTQLADLTSAIWQRSRGSKRLLKASTYQHNAADAADFGAYCSPCLNLESQLVWPSLRLLRMAGHSV